MKIDYELKTEREQLASNINKAISKKQFSLINIFDKVKFIETLYESMNIDDEIELIFDEDISDCPNFLLNDMPRLIIQKHDTQINVIDFLDNYGIQITKELNKFILTIKKNKSDLLNFNLRLDRNRTIDLKKLAHNKNIYGIRSYYFINKNE